MSQGEMIKAIRDGGVEAFHLFYQDMARSAYSSILSLIRNPEEVEDAMQDIYSIVWTKVGPYILQGKPLAWVFTITRNLCYTQFREQKMKTDVALEDLAENKKGEHRIPLEQAADRRVLLDALGRISREERQIVLSYVAAGMKRREVAGALQIPLVTILPKYNRSVKKLQELLRYP